MPFAYAGTRRRRNRDRRRGHDTPESSNPQNREGSPDARSEHDPMAARRASSEESPAGRAEGRSSAESSVESESPDSREGVDAKPASPPDERS